MPIQNPTPLNLNTADKLWVTHCAILPTSLQANLSPWDGDRLAGNPSDCRRVSLRDQDHTAIFAEVARVTGKTNIKVIDVDARDPGKSIRANVIYETGETREVKGVMKPVMGVHTIRDLFAAVAGDPALAAAYGTVMAAIAGGV